MGIRCIKFAVVVIERKHSNKKAGQANTKQD